MCSYSNTYGFAANGIIVYINGSKIGIDCYTYDECYNLLCSFNKDTDNVIIDINPWYKSWDCPFLPHDDSDHELRAVFTIIQNNETI